MPANDHMPQRDAAPKNDTAQASSPARRRALLKGLGKTAALAGAAVPLRSLAGSDRMRLKKNDNKNYQCSVSGNLSVLMSNGAEALPECAGKPPSHYSSTDRLCNTNARTKWTNWWNDGTNAVCYKNSQRTAYCQPRTTFSSAFGSGSSTMIGALCNLTTPNDEAHWVAALLNSNVRAASFPHSPEQVIALYQDTNKRANALAFFKNWMTRA